MEDSDGVWTRRKPDLHQNSLRKECGRFYGKLGKMKDYFFSMTRHTHSSRSLHFCRGFKDFLTYSEKFPSGSVFDGFVRR